MSTIVFHFNVKKVKCENVLYFKYHFFCIQNSMYCHKNLQCKLFYNEYNTVKWICYICTCNVWFLLWIYLYLLFYNTHIQYSENNLFECLLPFLLSIK